MTEVYLGHLDSEHEGKRERGQNQQHGEESQQQRAHPHTTLTPWVRKYEYKKNKSGVWTIGE